MPKDNRPEKGHQAKNSPHLGGIGTSKNALLTDAQAARIMAAAYWGEGRVTKANRARMPIEFQLGCNDLQAEGRAGVDRWEEETRAHRDDPVRNAAVLEAWAVARSEAAPVHAAGGGNGESGPPESPATANGEVIPARSECTDLGNAYRLVRDHGKRLRYCGQWGKWLFFDGKRWQEDSTGDVYRLAMKTVRGIGAEASNVEDDADRKRLLKWAIQSQSRKAIDAMVHLARFVAGMAVTPSMLDQDPWLLNVRNGTVDLQTGKLRPHDQADMITKLADVAYDPAATCPRWERFELEIMDNDPLMVDYLRRVVGYGMTADVREHSLYFFQGDGRNGKSLYLNTILMALGDYGTTIDASLITAKHQDDHPTGLTDLEGRRFVCTIEVEDGKKMAEALVKKLTGGDSIRARRMRQDFYVFKPTHKIILAANHKPEIRGTDRAIWQRVKLIPFPMTFMDADDPDWADPEKSKKSLPKDKTLDKTLAAELPGILALMVRSCLAWQREGMHEPAGVAAAVADYRAEMDDLAAFFEERCVRVEGTRVNSGHLKDAYISWCKKNDCTPLGKMAFAKELTRRGFKAAESNGKSYRLGINLRDEAFELG